MWLHLETMKKNRCIKHKRKVYRMVCVSGPLFY